MAHREQKEYLLKIKNQFPDRFINCSVLDIGSLDINGNNRYLFDKYTYTGIDIGAGKNVDIVCAGHLFKSDHQFDIVISTECFEHDMHYSDTIINAINLTKSGGMFLFTCATTGRPEHGTSIHSPSSSPFTNMYYKNLTENDIREFLEVDEIFNDYAFEINKFRSDLYFYGIKK